MGRYHASRFDSCVAMEAENGGACLPLDCLFEISRHFQSDAPGISVARRACRTWRDGLVAFSPASAWHNQHVVRRTLSLWMPYRRPPRRQYRAVLQRRLHHEDDPLPQWHDAPLS